MNLKLHPMVPAEFWQSVRSLPKAIGVQLVMAAGARLIFGDTGLVITWLIVMPNLAMSVGMGMFSEEYEKGQLRYLYGWPIRRGAIYGIKLVSGLLFIATMIGTQWLFDALWPGPPVADVLAQVPWPQLTVPSMVLLSVGFAMYTMGGGLLGMSACRSIKHAALIALPVVYGLMGVMLIGWIALRGLPTTSGLIIVVYSGAVALLAGNYLLFRGRNPFLDQVWRWRFSAAAVGVAAVFCTTIAGLAVLRPFANPGRALTEGTLNFSISPDGQRVLVLGTDGLTSHLAVFDDRGKLQQYLGSNQSMVYGDAAWVPDGGVLSEQQHLTVDSLRGQEMPKIELHLHEDGKPSRPIWPPPANPDAVDPESRVSWHRWSPDGRELWGYWSDYRDGERTLAHARVQAQTGQYIETPIPIPDAWPAAWFDDGRLLLEQNLVNDAGDRTTCLIWFDPSNQSTRSIALPDDTLDTAILTGRREAITLSRRIGDARVEFDLHRVPLDDPDAKPERIDPADAPMAMSLRETISSFHDTPIHLYPSSAGSGVLMVVSVEVQMRANLAMDFGATTEADDETAESDAPDEEAEAEAWLLMPGADGLRAVEGAAAEGLTFDPQQTRSFAVRHLPQPEPDESQADTLEFGDSPPPQPGELVIYAVDMDAKTIDVTLRRPIDDLGRQSYYAWLGPDRLLYQRQGDTDDIHANFGTLRVLDIETGLDELFIQTTPEAIDAAAKP
ncbi:MAG: ABC transporter permease [Planctomycetota bacterium]